MENFERTGYRETPNRQDKAPDLVKEKEIEMLKEEMLKKKEEILLMEKRLEELGCRSEKEILEVLARRAGHIDEKKYEKEALKEKEILDFFGIGQLNDFDEAIMLMRRKIEESALSLEEVTIVLMDLCGIYNIGPILHKSIQSFAGSLKKMNSQEVAKKIELSAPKAVRLGKNVQNRLKVEYERRTQNDSKI